MTRKISDVTVEELLQDINSPGVSDRDDVEIWLESEGYYPGTTPISASEMYQRYRDWRGRNSDIIGKIKNFGEVGSILTSQFPKKRRKNGYFYYISRKAEPSIPDDMLR